MYAGMKCGSQQKGLGKRAHKDELDEDDDWKRS